jgi:hypothetical protein
LRNQLSRKVEIEVGNPHQTGFVRANGWQSRADRTSALVLHTTPPILWRTTHGRPAPAASTLHRRRG